MFGYATNETENYMPYAIYIAHKLSKRYQDALSNKEFNDDNGNAKFLKLLKVSGYYAHSVSVFTKLLQLNGSFCTASLNLCTKSLSQHV